MHWRWTLDISIPPEVHHLLNDYPIAPSQLEVNQDMISTTSREVRRQLDLPYTFKAVKMVPNLLDKKNYITALPNLQFYISKGARVEFVHSVVSYTQKAWLKPYIDMITERRQSAASESENFRYKMPLMLVLGSLFKM